MVASVAVSKHNGRPVPQSHAELRYGPQSALLLLSEQGQRPLQHWKAVSMAGKPLATERVVDRVYCRSLRGYFYRWRAGGGHLKWNAGGGHATLFPGKSSNWLAVQVRLPDGVRSFAIEVGVMDGRGGRRRLHFSMAHRLARAQSPLHAIVPLAQSSGGPLEAEQWTCLVVDLPSAIDTLFPTASGLKCIESVDLTGSEGFFLRKIFLMPPQPRIEHLVIPFDFAVHDADSHRLVTRLLQLQLPKAGRPAIDSAADPRQSGFGDTEAIPSTAQIESSSKPVQSPPTWSRLPVPAHSGLSVSKRPVASPARGMITTAKPSTASKNGVRSIPGSTSRSDNIGRTVKSITSSNLVAISKTDSVRQNAPSGSISSLPPVVSEYEFPPVNRSLSAQDILQDDLKLLKHDSDGATPQPTQPTSHSQLIQNENVSLGSLTATLSNLKELDAEIEVIASEMEPNPCRPVELPADSESCAIEDPDPVPLAADHPGEEKGTPTVDPLFYDPLRYQDSDVDDWERDVMEGDVSNVELDNVLALYGELQCSETEPGQSDIVINRDGYS